MALHSIGRNAKGLGQSVYYSFEVWQAPFRGVGLLELVQKIIAPIRIDNPANIGLDYQFVRLL